MAEGSETETTSSLSRPSPPSPTGVSQELGKNYTSTASISVSYKKNVPDSNSFQENDQNEASALVHMSKQSSPKNRERSKTPPPNMTKSSSHKGFSDFLFGEGKAKGPQEREESRDSGVHLDCGTHPEGEGKSGQEEGEDGSRRHSKSSSLPHGVKLCPEGTNSTEEDRANNLEQELFKAQTELKERDAEVEILKGIRQQVEGELEDLTASLFVVSGNL